MLGSLSVDGNLAPLPEAQLTHIEEVAAPTTVGGIILPPPDVRTIIDKTSQLVAKNGLQFEKRIIVTNAGNAFDFLNTSNPYHAYYQQKLAEFRALLQSPPPVPSTTDDSSHLLSRLEEKLDPLDAAQYTGFKELSSVMLGSLSVDGNLAPLPEAQLTHIEQVNEKLSIKEVAAPTTVGGIILPPSDIRTIVDKISQSVAKIGLEFEKRIIASCAGIAKFNFLNSSNPYHAYYQQKLAEFRVLLESPPPVPLTTDSSDLLSRLEKHDPLEGITRAELATIRLTARCVARHGKSVLTGLTSREINDLELHFLEPTHSLFTFFTSLVDAYVLMPPKGSTDEDEELLPPMMLEDEETLSLTLTP